MKSKYVTKEEFDELNDAQKNTVFITWMIFFLLCISMLIIDYELSKIDERLENVPHKVCHNETVKYNLGDFNIEDAKKLFNYPKSTDVECRYNLFIEMDYSRELSEWELLNCRVKSTKEVCTIE